MLTPEQRVELIREAMDRGHSSQLGDGGPEAIAVQIREAVAAERERCAKIVEKELTPGQDPYGFQPIVREILTAIREGKE